MVVCPIALAIGCLKCPIFKTCPVKGIIGDYKKPGIADKSVKIEPKKDRTK